MRLIPLGTNGFFSSFNRQTACYAIPHEKTLIILDAGTGLFRLAEPAGKRLLSGIKEVHLYLSHYHLDHTFGFYAAFDLLKDKKVTVFGSHKRQVLWEFVTLKYFPIDYAKKHKNFKWINLDEGKHKIADYKVSVRKQNHRGEESLAYCFDFPARNALANSACVAGGGLAYITDGEPTKENIEFAKGMPLLLHEHGFTGEKLLGKGNVNIKKHILDGHVTTVGAALVAKKANVGKLALIHHLPYVDIDELKKQLKVARSIFPKTRLTLDFEEISF